MFFSPFLCEILKTSIQRTGNSGHFFQEPQVSGYRQVRLYKKKLKISRISLIIILFFSRGFNFADGPLKIFRRDLISRFFLNPRNSRKLIPLKYVKEYKKYGISFRHFLCTGRFDFTGRGKVEIIYFELKSPFFQFKGIVLIYLYNIYGHKTMMALWMVQMTT